MKISKTLFNIRDILYLYMFFYSFGGFPFGDDFNRGGGGYDDYNI
jgi:hypothetical protein